MSILQFCIMPNKTFLLSGIAATLFGLSEPLYAISLTSPDSLSPHNTVINFDNLPTGILRNPYSINGVTISSNSPLIIGKTMPVAAINFPALTQGNALSSFNQFSQFSPITLNFSQPIAEIGLTWIDPNWVGNFLQAFNSSDQLIEQVVSPLGPTGGIFATFVGIKRPTNDIARVVIKNSAPGDYYAIDRISFSSIVENKPPEPASVPEPTNILGLLVGVFATVSLLKRKQLVP